MQRGDGPLAWGVLGLAGGFEYVFPPFPGDTVTLFGAFLVATAGYNPFGVWLSVTLGSMVGSLGAYALGRRLASGREAQLPWLQGPRAAWALDKVAIAFDRNGSWVLLLNRFVPALRAFFFVGAGVARMHPGLVLLYGGISAGAWNALLLGAGYAVGDHWDRLQALYQRYTVGALAVAGLLLGGLVVRALVRARRR